MELGQIKLDYNNEVLKIRKHFIQSKTQCINNLSRKGKQLKSHQTSDKCPTEIKEKSKHKLENVVAEIFFMKKLKHNEVAHFAMLNFDKLTKIIDSPLASKEKAMAKIVLHKVLKPKFLEIKEKFSHIPTEKLLEVDPKKQKIKNKKKEKSKLKKAELEKSSENVKNTLKKKEISISQDSEEDGDEVLNNFYNKNPEKKAESNNSSDSEESVVIPTDEEDSANEDNIFTNLSKKTDDGDSGDESVHIESSDQEIHSENKLEIEVSNSNTESIHRKCHSDTRIYERDDEVKTDTLNSPKKVEKASRNKHKNERMFVDMDDDNINSTTQKIVDSFFMTESGDNYLTVAIPRPPDVVNKDIGDGEFNQFNNTNRRLRRAAMFGNNVVSRKKKSFEPRQYNSSPNKMTDFKGSKNLKDTKKQDGYSQNSQSKPDFSSRNNSRMNKSGKDVSLASKVPEKLHPSWEAKKQKMSILPFQGKKVTFD